MGTHPIFESDFDCLTDRFGLKTSQPWAVCTHQERVFLPQQSHTADPSHHGKNKRPRRSRMSSTSSPRRVTSHHSLVFTFVIPTVLVSPTTLLAPRSSASLMRWVLPQSSQRI